MKLEELRKAKKITFWFAMYHFAEDDEGGKKDHFHVYIEPSCQIFTDDLMDEFKEFDPLNPDKPLKTLKFVSSKIDDMLMYCLHDKAYLASKGQSRKFSYEYDMFLTSDSDQLLFEYRSIDFVGLTPYLSMLDAQKNGLSFEDYYRRGTVPIAQTQNYMKAWYLLLSDHTERNGNSNHEI